MENFGHVMFQPRAMLFDEQLLNEEEKNGVSKAVSQQLAHMWFGNIVTMKWWNDLWVNEGFSFYFMLKGVDLIAPGDTYDQSQFQLLTLHPSLYGLDGSPYSPILSPDPATTRTAEEMEELFDNAQERGTCMVKMMGGILRRGEFNARSAGLFKSKAVPECRAR